MKVFFTILVCKILKLIGGLIGKGSSLPGQIALKLCPDILKRVKLPQYIIAVTGSNGKTSTVEMIAHILNSSGKRIAWNKEGSNQIEGVTTLILSSCSLKGEMNCDILLIESDERYAKYTFKYFAPTHYVITNLYRDQLTRNGHPQWVFGAIRDSIHEQTQLILNADDPLVSLFGYNKENTVWFGVDRHKNSFDTVTGVYNDGYFCPVCGKKMEYSYTHYNHIGDYKCSECGFCKHETQFTVTDVDLDSGEICINGKSKIALSLHSMYNIYNVLAAYSVCSLLGVESDTIEQSINNYVLKNGRVVEFKLGEHNGTLLTSKHENSVSYDQSLKIAADSKEKCCVMIIVDAVSRKYFTGEVSWLWDINFDLLQSDNVSEVVLSGTYANDLAVRFQYSEVTEDKIKVMPSITEAADYLKANGSERLFVITCFSDKDKILLLTELK